ncbi:hypothetical protein [Desulforamulus ferrireducens]|uniref:Uncharacterized protein n=1 Tax=Desulforamulus ferrireducens TaxID=1833852 RepID=A0A1S6IYP9_9FIRM|nr:hypothetical protein [Desulforamulus ferrireducens]AQS59903.1 hypothetical protein B0537_12935 [Desulforamulus ferrireducens]
MDGLFLMLVLWVIFRVLNDRKKNQQQPIPRLPEDEEPAYRLPPDLRRKWGSPTPQEEVAQIEEVTPPKKYKIAVPAAVTPSVQKSLTTVEKKAPVLKKEEAPRQASCTAGLDILNPATAQQGIILSEILGPPLAKRRRNNIFH